MARLLVPLLLLASTLHCARSARPEASVEVTPRYEHVFQKPLEEALATTRELLTERGHTFEEMEDPTLLLTRWKAGASASAQRTSVQERYLVMGIRVAPRQSVVRIFLARSAFMVNDAEKRDGRAQLMKDVASVYFLPAPNVDLGTVKAPEGDPTRGETRGLTRGTRDVTLEKELTLRLESGPSVETVAGNVRETPPARELARDPAFYLQQWRQDAAGTASADRLCAQRVKGWSELLRPGLMLLVGEQLGTNETPRVVGDLVCEAAQAGLAVTLGVPLSKEEQGRLDAYLASPGAPADQDALLRGDFWRKPQQDGRGSRAMMELVDRVRSLRAAGLPVGLVAFGVETAQGSARDMQMADVLLRRREKQRGHVFVVLAGNVHMRTVRGVEWDAGFTPMAWHLRNADRGLVSLDLSYAQGRRWGCELDRAAKLTCGVVGATPRERVAAAPGMQPYVQRFSEPTEEGYHGLLYVGALSPSLPAASLYGTEAPVPSSMPQHLIDKTRVPARPDAPPIF